MKLPNLPADRQIAEGVRLTDQFWLFFDGLARWIRGAQMLQAVQSDLAALGAKLQPKDAGLLVEITDYAHVLRWSGAGWEWGPAEEGGGYFRPFAVAPTGSGWHACDGSAGIKYLKANGTTGTLTLPNTAGGAAYLKAAATYASAITAATAPTATNPATTAAHALTTAEIPNHAHGLTQIKYTANYTTAGSSVGLTGAGAAISQATDGAGGGGSHDHALSNPTVALPGDPVANFQAIYYFRQ